MEIGGYLELEEFTGSEYYSGLKALNTGRNALAVLIRCKGIKRLYIPEYLCDSVYKVCVRENCEYEFYKVTRDFQPEFNKSLAHDEWVYVVNYYGQVTNEKELKKKYARMIYDNVQAFFQKPIKGIDTIYSCRKFFGVPDGAYLASDVNIHLPADVSKDRMVHILGRFEACASDYYNDFTANDVSFYDLEPKAMSKLTHNILRAVNYEEVKKRRESNFAFYHERLKDKNPISLKCPVGPYMYPFYSENGKELKKKLQQKKIYIPTLWPDAVQFGGLAREYSENILPLPCDQRYTAEDLKHIVMEITG